MESNFSNITELNVYALFDKIYPCVICGLLLNNTNINYAKSDKIIEKICRCESNECIRCYLRLKEKKFICEKCANKKCSFCKQSRNVREIDPLVTNFTFHEKCINFFYQENPNCLCILVFNDDFHPECQNRLKNLILTRPKDGIRGALHLNIDFFEYSKMLVSYHKKFDIECEGLEEHLIRLKKERFNNFYNFLFCVKQFQIPRDILKILRELIVYF